MLANLDAVTLLLRNRPALSEGSKQMQEELSQMLAEAGLPGMNQRELRVMCNLLSQQQRMAKKGWGRNGNGNGNGNGNNPNILTLAKI